MIQILWEQIRSRDSILQMCGTPQFQVRTMFKLFMWEMFCRKYEHFHFVSSLHPERAMVVEICRYNKFL